MKIANIILAILFAVFAAFQINDIDPWLWIGLYGFVSVLYIFAVRQRFNIPIIAIGILVTAIGVGLLTPDFIDWVQQGMPTITESMKAEEQHIELTREFLGLIILLAALIFLLIQARKETSN